MDLLFDWFGISCMTTDNFCFYLQNRQIQTSQTGGQWYSDTSPFSIPWNRSLMSIFVPTFTIISFKLVYRDHAEMQAMAYARDTHDSIEMIGVSKPPCHPCEKELDRHGAEHHHDEDGLRNPRNWESPGTNVIKLFTSVIYEFFVISYCVCPWQAYPALSSVYR
jgi:hypothetical protein